jgi:phosphate transport system substrate-binding protein
MKKMYRAPAANATVALLLAALVTGTMAEEIKIGGTGNGLGTMRLMGAAFSKAYPEVQVRVLGSLGSSGAIKAVPKGALDIGLTSRVLTEQERKEGLVITEYARTPTVFAVAQSSGLTALTRGQIADIYAGRLVKWADGTSIRPILRQPGDDNTRQVRGLSMAIDQALNIAEKRPGLPFAVIDQEAADKIETIPGGIGVTTLALIKSEGRSLKALAVDTVEPTTQNAASGAYPLVKHFYFVTMGVQTPSVQKFIEFVKTAAGRDLLASNGHWIP